jgi:glycosyltransferase involved in cell wall biosynthesis
LKKNISCIIPFYNENSRLKHTLKVFDKVSLISHIILVNDGSSDESKVLAENFIKGKSRFNLINLKKNMGKSYAIKKGLKLVKSNYILLHDADLIGISSEKIHKALSNAIADKSESKMIIFKRKQADFIQRLFNFDAMLSGERIIEKDLLESIIKMNPKGYELEVMINQHIIEQNEMIKIVNYNVRNPKRINKWGLTRSILSNLEMIRDIIKSVGMRGLLRQIEYFNSKIKYKS